jgi:hypothetical protein
MERAAEGNLVCRGLETRDLDLEDPASFSGTSLNIHEIDMASYPK